MEYKREREKQKLEAEKKTQLRVAPPPYKKGPNEESNRIQYRVPNVCLDVRPHIFIKASSWAAAVSPYLHRLANFQVIY